MSVPLPSRLRKTFFLLPILALAFPALSPAQGADKDKDGFTPIFDGKSLKGWHPSAQSGHSNTSGNKSGGRWVVEDGAIIGSQDVPGNGGLLLSDEEYGDFEVALEMRNDFGPDSGLFLRSTEDGKCYQAMIDYHGGGNVMGIYGEGLGGKPHLRNYAFLDKPETIKVVEELDGVRAPVALPVTVEKWPEFWQHGTWQELRARIESNPPRITTWIKGVKFMEWTEAGTEKRLGDKGRIGLQVHGGGDFTRQFVRYRNIRVKVLGAKAQPAAAATPATAPAPAKEAKLAPGGQWPEHSMERPRPPVVPAQYDGQPVPMPAGAKALFDGKDLSQWKQDKPDAATGSDAAKWKVENGCFEVVPKTGAIVTREPIKGSIHLHIEWATPAEVKGNGQGRGNSGVFIGGLPELQVLDSWENDTYPDGQAGAFYSQYPPLANASRKPGEWQCYDVFLERARLENGQVVQKQRVTVRHNGVLVQDKVEFDSNVQEGTLNLQDHSNPMRFRNIWVAPLPAAGAGEGK